MIQTVLQPSSLQYAEAVRRVRESGDYRKSLRGRQARQVGFLGEIIVRDILVGLGIDYRETRTTRHDAMVNGLRIEVKTKERTVEPRPHYEVSIAAYNSDHQDVHAYIFVSMLNSDEYRPDDVRRLVKAFVVGVANQAIIERHAIYRPEGAVDHRNNFATPMACHNLRHDQLMSLPAFVQRSLYGNRSAS